MEKERGITIINKDKGTVNGVLDSVRVCICGYCGRLLGDNNMPNPTIQGLDIEIPSNAERVEGSCCVLKERGII